MLCLRFLILQVILIAWNGNHGVAVVLDCYEKGLRGFDLSKAYEVCKSAITEKTLAPWSDKKGEVWINFLRKMAISRL